MYLLPRAPLYVERSILGPQLSLSWETTLVFSKQFPSSSEFSINPLSGFEVTDNSTLHPCVLKKHFLWTLDKTFKVRFVHFSHQLSQKQLNYPRKWQWLHKYIPLYPNELYSKLHVPLAEFPKMPLVPPILTAWQERKSERKEIGILTYCCKKRKSYFCRIKKKYNPVNIHCAPSRASQGRM